MGLRLSGNDFITLSLSLVSCYSSFTPWTGFFERQVLHGGGLVLILVVPQEVVGTVLPLGGFELPDTQKPHATGDPVKSIAHYSPALSY
ncbi:hypothetical protein V6N11_059127 [Hibiscus sabdariffa]|uniref:Uncharacterized protein n=1 Tax=Hibiscus sabdariffa TaxID=183260 RepID=A0ABR2U698_9ROSI